MTNKIDAWEASDGQVFRSYEEAEAYETKLEFLKWFKEKADDDYVDASEKVERIFKAWNVTRKD